MSYNGGRGSLVTVLHGRNPCLPDFWNSVESDVTSDDENDALKAYVCHYSKVMENGIFIPDSMFTTYFPSRTMKSWCVLVVTVVNLTSLVHAEHKGYRIKRQSNL